MVPKCIVPGCNTGRNKSTNGISRFRVPANGMTRRAWNKVIGLNRDLTSNDYVCAKHFLLKDIRSVVNTSGSVPSIRPRLKKGAKPVLQVGDEKSEVSKNSSKHLRSVKNESDVPHLHVANITVKSPENLSSPLRNARTKKKGKEAADPLDIKMDSEEIDTTQSSLPQNLQYVDPQTFIGSIMINEELQLLRARVAELEFQNLDLKNRNTELTTALTQAESEKKQLKAELDSALLANRKLNIVKHSLINTITNLGKNLGAGALPTLDPTLDMSDTIVGI